MNIFGKKSTGLSPEFSKHVLLALVVLLCVIVGMLITAIYFQKMAMDNNLSGIGSQSMGNGQKGTTSDQSASSSLNASLNTYVSFSATVKKIEGNKVTLTNLPNFTNDKNNSSELIVVVSANTQLTRYDVDEKQTSIDSRQLSEIPANMSDMKAGSSLFVELAEPADFGGAVKTVEAKKIRINGSPPSS